MNVKTVNFKDRSLEDHAERENGAPLYVSIEPDKVIHICILKFSPENLKPSPDEDKIPPIPP